MAIPLRHFVVGLGFLLAGVVLEFGVVWRALPGGGTIAHVHLLLVGWICVTIMGAMTQLVPVWSGVTLHSRRLADLQLLFVTVGLVGFAIALLAGSFAWLVPFGGLVLAGFWTFVYNIGRTMAAIGSFDRTERHFALSLGFFVVLTPMGLLLALDFTTPAFDGVRVVRSQVVAAHATVAVFGGVLTTIYGALYQLGTMFTQTELHALDERLATVEGIGHSLGVGLLAAGRLGGDPLLARAGGLAILLAAVAMGTIVARKLHEMRVPRTPMHTRYAIAVVALLSWALLSVPAWLRDPIAPMNRFGTAGAGHLLVLGAIGFVLLGTLYHVVPFIVWVHRYSDRLGLEDVPMVDDLYDSRLAVADAWVLTAGTVILVVAEWFGLSGTAFGIAGGLLAIGFVAFAANMLWVLHVHSPRPIGTVVLGSLDPRRWGRSTA